MPARLARRSTSGTFGNCGNMRQAAMRRVAGALAYERDRGRFRLYSAGAIILATGGIGRACGGASGHGSIVGIRTGAAPTRLPNAGD